MISKNEATANRATAIATGVKRYIGRPCLKRKHVESGGTERWIIKSKCVKCSVEETAARAKRPDVRAKIYAREAVRRREPGRKLLAVKGNAKVSGTPFKITLSDIGDFPLFCPILGIPITPNAHSRAPGLPSVDRLIPELGYVPGNVRWVSFRGNQLRSNGTAEEHWLLVKDDVRVAKMIIKGIR
jgi:hypothetical protein